jgi:hypothetical protein
VPPQRDLFMGRSSMTPQRCMSSAVSSSAAVSWPCRNHMVIVRTAARWADVGQRADEHVADFLQVGLSVICVQKVPLRKARKINALRHAPSANQLKYRQIQLLRVRRGSVRQTNNGRPPATMSGIPADRREDGQDDWRTAAKRTTPSRVSQVGGRAVGLTKPPLLRRPRKLIRKILRKIMFKMAGAKTSTR